MRSSQDIVVFGQYKGLDIRLSLPLYMTLTETPPLLRSWTAIFIGNGYYQVAFAYKMKLEALKHQGKATDETSRQLVGKCETADIISETDSGRQVQRYIRLTNLIPALLRYVDEGKIALTPAVALSYLYPYEQEILVEAMEYHDCTPSLSQALYLKGISQAGVLDEKEVYKVMSEEKANQKEHIRFSKDELRRFFPGGYSSKQMSDAIIKMLEARQRVRENRGGDAR